MSAVIGGPLISWEGMVMWSSAEWVKLLLSALDRSVKVELSVADMMALDAVPVL